MVNTVVLVGRITKDPEVRQTSGSVGVCNFTCAVNRSFKNQAGEREADFVNCVAFNKVASLMEQYVRKGQLISIEGRIQTRNYENTTGQRIYVTEVVANQVTFLESRSDNGYNSSPNEPTPPPSAPKPGLDVEDFSIDDDDLPF